MKTLTPSNINSYRTFLLYLILLFAAGFCRGQAPSASVQPVVEDYAITQVGPHSRVWGNSAGQTVTEISTGMNFWDGQQWTPSNPSFQVSADGTAFVASQIQDPTRLAANLNCVGAVTVTTPDNVTLRSTPIAIGLYDAASGKSVIVATLTNTTGVMTDPQDVVYDRAFVGGGFAASVVYSLPDTGSFHQDIVFVGFDPGFNPTNWGFAANAASTLQIQIFTEFYDSPQPRMLTNQIYVEKNPVIRARMDSPDLIDYTLDFGHYVFGHGRAYTTASSSGGVRVLKDFVTSEGRTYLVESIPYRWLASELQALPPVVSKTSSLKHPPGARKMRVAAASLPPLPAIKPEAVEKIKPAKTTFLAAAKPRGVDVDYWVTVSSTVEPTLYCADTTYFVSGTVVESSAVTMESAVFKYPTNNIGVIEIEGTLTMSTTNYRPAIFTAADDNTAGAPLSTIIWTNYSGIVSSNYYGSAAVEMDATGNIAMNNVRFCYMSDAIELNAAPWNPVFTLSHAQLTHCSTGIQMIGSSDGGGDDFVEPLTLDPNPLTLNLNNCLMGNVLYPFATTGSVIMTDSACNCTIDSCTDLFELAGSGKFTFVNSIFSRITSEGSLGSITLSGVFNGFYSSPTFGTYISTSASPYQSAGAGNYYLASPGVFLTNGTTSVSSTLTNEAASVFAALLSQLQMKTTQAPLNLTNIFTNNTVLTPVAQRDTTGTALGWHYDPIDYIAGCAVSNATLFLTNGVALAYYDSLGIWLQSGSQLVSQGAPNYRNYLAYYGQVQEQPVNLWGVTNALAQSLPFAFTNEPSIFLRLTTICAPTGETYLLNTSDSNQAISGLVLRDCEVYGSGADWVMNESNNTPIIGLTNNVFYRIPFAISNSATITCYNNLFYGTTNSPGNLTNTAVSIRYRGTNSPNTNENNVFDGVQTSLDGLVGYNAYLNGGTNSAITNNSFHTNLVWLGGPLGAYYQATNGPLINKGSTTADQLGLYQYTVTTNLIGGLEIKETNSIVDLGYHYVAVNSSGIPISTPGDGIPDYLADTNGNGGGSWTNYNSPNGLTTANGLMVFTPLK
jgi:hypothetical protein